MVLPGCRLCGVPDEEIVRRIAGTTCLTAGEVARVIEDVIALYLPTSLTNVGVSSSGVVFLLLLLVLLLRPAGLLGRAVQSRV